MTLGNMSGLFFHMRGAFLFPKERDSFPNKVALQIELSSL